MVFENMNLMLLGKELLFFRCYEIKGTEVVVEGVIFFIIFASMVVGYPDPDSGG